jgi:diguanylate cyclase (GGDEF)-like protein
VAVSVRDVPTHLDSEFRASRVAALAEINGSIAHFGLAAAMILLFSLWDRFVDPVRWTTSLLVRLAAVAVILATGFVQRVSGRVDWAPLIAKVRFSASVLAVAGANAIVEQGYVVGLAGLVAVFLGGPYIVLDKRDYLPTTLIPLSGVALVMWRVGLDRFAVINACVFLALTLVVGFMLARVFDATNRRAFALEHALKQEARTDPLTRLANRRSIEETMAVELRRQTRSGRPVALILCDVDHFKRINDEQGHDVGDQTIRAVGESLQSVMRATDTLGRWGGEEFVAILPDTNEDEAALLAERMRATVEATPMPGPPGSYVTVSLGVASAATDLDRPDDAGLEAILKAADGALYRAKAAGRNRVKRARAAAVVSPLPS